MHLKLSSSSCILAATLFTGLINSNIQAEDYVYITTGADLATESLVHTKSARDMEFIKSNNGISLVKVPKSEVDSISHLAHEEYHRCGGFMLHESYDEALWELEERSAKSLAKNVVFADYNLDQDVTVNQFISEISEANIRSTIVKLSSYKNRYYKSQTGVDSQDWLYNTWKDLGKNRTDFTVEKWEHSSWDQPSVVATLKGKSDEIIVIGGHGDSIAGFWNRARATAPGADDNASGIATVTEALRVLVQSNYVPEKTIKFMSYAAEEVGLLGSKAIATDFNKNNKPVVGVLQLDMTNYNGSELDIVLMTDYTNSAQNAFIGTLIDKYLPEVSWGYDKCGYGCSDHASWHSQGFPASVPFEARMNDMNDHIHSSRDTIDQSGGTADHAQKFAKLAVAYIVELDK